MFRNGHTNFQLYSIPDSGRVEIITIFIFILFCSISLFNTSALRYFRPHNRICVFTFTIFHSRNMATWREYSFHLQIPHRIIHIHMLHIRGGPCRLFGHFMIIKLISILSYWVHWANIFCTHGFFFHHSTFILYLTSAKQQIDKRYLL